MSASESVTLPAARTPSWATAAARLRTIAPGVAFCLLSVLLWDTMARVQHSPLAPRVAEIGREMLRLLAGGMAVQQVGITLGRILLGGVAACVLAFVLALASARSSLLRAFLRPAVLLGLTVPGLVWALLCVIWFGIGWATPVVSITLGVAPPLMVTITEGLRAVDPELTEMAQVFRFSRWSRMRYVLLPSITPFLLSGIRLSFSLGWKVIVLVELFGMSDGVGYQLNSEFGAQNVAGVVAWTVVFWAVMAVIEFGFIGALEARLTGWRREIRL